MIKDEFYQKNNTRRKKNRNGFTFIEVMIIVTIIAILASVILVYVVVAKQRASSSKFKSVLSGAAPLLSIRCISNNGSGTVTVTNAELNNVLSGDIVYSCAVQTPVSISPNSSLGAFPACNNSLIGESGAKFPSGC